MSRESQVIELFTRETDPLSVADIAAREGCSRPTIYMILKRNGVALTRARKASFRRQEAGRAGQRKLRAPGGALRRFVNAKAEPGRVRILAADHPAVVASRTLFPSTVVGTFGSPRFLVSGENNSKIGKKVLKGRWAGMPVYMLSLEERATCPASCDMWRGCFGNALHLARRNDARDPDFIPALAAEVITMARVHTEGFVVRLHVLGDFFSVPYVRMWGHLLDMLPMLNVYGYTHRREDLDDADSQAIAREIRLLTERDWNRFSVRTSHTEAGPDRTVVVMEPTPGILMCPSQTEATETCGSCALCWSESARDKTVGFLLHGMKNRGGPNE